MENHVTDREDQALGNEAEQVVVQIAQAPLPLQYGLAPPRFVIPVAVTVGVVVGATGIGAFICTYIRTMGWGFSIRGFVVSSAFCLALLGPFVVIASLGRRVRTMLTCLAILILVAPLIAEGLASAQEIGFVRRSKLVPGTPMSEARWWPFGWHGIGTDGKGTFYGYD